MGSDRSGNDNLYAFAADRLRDLEAVGRLRSLRVVEGAQGAWVRLDGREVLLLCSNNYLGLAGHPRLAEAASEAARRFGCGAGASRLISGTMTMHQRLERRLADFFGYPEALLFNSGYAANVGVISSLVGAGDIVFSDALNHASIIDGCRLSRAEIRVYPHRDTEALRGLLEKDRGAGRRRLIVTDSLFSMDGDLAPLAELVEQARRYGCLLMADEAHAVGILGKKGKGAAEMAGIDRGIDVLVGTMGKALGSFGAFVVCAPVIKEYLIHHARSFVFSTALPPPVLAAALAALDIVEQEPGRRAHVAGLAHLFRKGLCRVAARHGRLGTDAESGGPALHIQGLVLGDDRVASAFSQGLLERGVYAQAIRPPTVPVGTARVRFSLTAAHTRRDVEYALGAIEDTLQELCGTYPEAMRSLGVVPSAGREGREERR
jgi:8-amino-7-oxononanoate synthase